MTNHRFWLVLSILLGGFVIAADAIFGQVSSISEIRIAARQFREEATYLAMPTKNLVPNIDHVYREWDNSQNPNQQPSAQFRKFQTDSNGVVTPASGGLHHNVTVLFLGGSTTECNEVLEAFRFPTVVERKLREGGLDAAVTNAGVRGHTTQDSINALLNRPGFRQADVIVLMENINDRLRLGIQGNYDARLGNVSPTSAQAVVGALSRLIEAAWDFLAYRSNTIFLLRYWADQNAAWHEGTHTVEVSERSIDLYEDAVLKNRDKFRENVELFVSIVRTLGKRPILMTQPLGRHSNAQDVFNEIIRSVAQHDGVTLVDLDEAVNPIRESAFLFDNIHLNNKGSKFVGELIALSLVPLIN